MQDSQNLGRSNLQGSLLLGGVKGWSANTWLPMWPITMVGGLNGQEVGVGSWSGQTILQPYL